VCSGVIEPSIWQISVCGVQSMRKPVSPIVRTLQLNEMVLTLVSRSYRRPPKDSSVANWLIIRALNIICGRLDWKAVAQSLFLPFLATAHLP
jgi:hypothetical protein